MCKKFLRDPDYIQFCKPSIDCLQFFAKLDNLIMTLSERRNVKRKRQYAQISLGAMRVHFFCDLINIERSDYPFLKPCNHCCIAKLKIILFVLFYIIYIIYLRQLY